MNAKLKHIKLKHRYYKVCLVTIHENLFCGTNLCTMKKTSPVPDCFVSLSRSTQSHLFSKDLFKIKARLEINGNSHGLLLLCS